MQGEGGEDGAALAQESTTLRWEAHGMQGATIALNLRFDDTVRTLESRGNDREAKEVMLRLAKEYKTLNDGLVSRLARLSVINRTMVEILHKSQDGKAALMMRKAAELLVKGLANAEEEVHSIRATVVEVEAQRDHYKGLLAKTNSELETSRAYAQMSKVIGQEACAASSATTTSSGRSAADGADDAVIKKRSGKRGSESESGAKGKAPSRQVRQKRTGVVAMLTSRPTRGSGISGGSQVDPPISTEAAEAAAKGGGNQNHGEVPFGPKVGNAKRGRGRTSASTAAAARGGGNQVAIQGAASLGEADDKTASTTTTATAAKNNAPRRKRQRDEVTATAGDDAEDVDEGRRRDGYDREEEGRRSRGDEKLATQSGVKVPLWEPGGLAGPPWSGDVEGEGVSGAVHGGAGGGESEDGGGGEGDGQSAYDSDDAPSMFF